MNDKVYLGPAFLKDGSNIAPAFNLSQEAAVEVQKRFKIIYKDKWSVEIEKALAGGFNVSVYKLKDQER